MTELKVFKGITNGVKAAVKWSGDKLVDIAHSKTLDKVMTTMAMAATGACTLLYAGYAIWILQFIAVAPITVVLVFICDMFVALWCLQMCLQLMVDRAVDTCFIKS